MGLSATTGRFLAMTARKHDITGMQVHYSNQKMALSRDMQRVSRNYQNALNSKIFKWSNNGGATYSDFSYNNLMRPSSMNQNKAYLLTDLAGRVVVDGKYKEYAEMITAKGGYDNCRNEILSQVTGISVDTLEQVHKYHDQIYETKIALDSFRPEPNPKDTRTYPGLMQVGIEGLLKKLGSSVGVSGYSFKNASNWADAYKDNKTINLQAGKTEDQNTYNYCYYGAQEIANQLASQLTNYLIDENDKKAFELAVAEVSGDDELGYKGIIGDSISSTSGCIEKDDDDNVCLKTRDFIDLILGAYFSNGGDAKTTSGYGNGNQDIIWYDINSDAYNNYLADKADWDAEHTALVEYFNELNAKSGQLLTSEQEQQINFYDEIFSSIAEKGWVYNNCVTDDNYLNQMLQNNMYTITEINRELICNGENHEHYYINHYKEDVAGNMPNIYQVSDEEAILEAQVEYENEKAIINEKETRIDLRMDTLKTELEAINTMLKSMEKIKKDNIDRTMNITG